MNESDGHSLLTFCFLFHLAGTLTIGRNIESGITMCFFKCNIYICKLSLSKRIVLYCNCSKI